MKAFVNENCIGCGLCESMCPEVFRMTDEGVAEAYKEYEGSLKQAVKEAMDECPVDAIEKA